jgi:hypothetical protein
MDHQQQLYLRKFEIEERVQERLPEPFKSQYKLIRATKAENITERIPSTHKNEEHWNSIVNKIINTYIITENQTTTPQQQQQINTVIEEDIEINQQPTETEMDNINQELLAAIQGLNKVLEKSSHQTNDEKDLYNKPFRYNGSRDPLMIENWITAVDDYTTYKDYNETQSYKFAKTLLIEIASVWIRNLEAHGDSAPTTWSSLKKLIRLNFKPANSTLIFREKLNALQQKTTISHYIEQFMTLKLGIPNMTDCNNIR